MPKVVVEVARQVLLHAEEEALLGACLLRPLRDGLRIAGRFGRALEIPLLTIFLESHGLVSFAHQAPDRLDQRKHNHSRRREYARDDAEKCFERHAAEEARRPARELVAERVRQEPDAHHQPDDAHRRRAW